MAVNTYLEKCEYKIGSLQNYIYLINKKAVSLKIIANRADVTFEKTMASDVYRLNCVNNVFNQEESNMAKFKFSNTLEITMLEKHKDPLFSTLEMIRKNDYYIVIEDKKNIQYLINAELLTNVEYAYKFDDTDEANNVVVTFTNLCNYPLLIMKNKIPFNKEMNNKECAYNLSRITSLRLAYKDTINVKDDGSYANNIYIQDTKDLKLIEYLKDSCSLVQEYKNQRYNLTLKFSIPLSDNQFNWHYNLIEYTKNVYKAIIQTTNGNTIIVNSPLSAKYDIATSEEEENLNTITITLTCITTIPLTYKATEDTYLHKWVDEKDTRCFGLDRYQMLTQYTSTDFGQTWNPTSPQLKKKGELVEKNSAECIDEKWVDAGGYCRISSKKEYEFILVDNEYICENGNKYEKTRLFENGFFTNIYAKGNLIESGSQDCRYIAAKWMDSDKITCLEVNEEYTKEEKDKELCEGTDYVQITREMVSNDNVNFYPTKVTKKEIIIPNCCACGYFTVERRKVGEVCGSDVNLASTTKYAAMQAYKVCDDGHTTTDEPIPNDITYEAIEEQSCDCGYVGYEYRKTGYICGSELGEEYLPTSSYEVWEEFETCSNIKTGNIRYKNPIKSCDCGYRIYEYRFDGEYICGSSLVGYYDIYSKYEIWNQHALCPDDPSIDEIVPNMEEYRNPVKSYDCGYQTYQWRIEDEETCGNALPKNTPIVWSEPEINVDKPYNENE